MLQFVSVYHFFSFSFFTMLIRIMDTLSSSSLHVLPNISLSYPYLSSFSLSVPSETFFFFPYD